jgi:hypothetical protein
MRFSRTMIYSAAIPAALAGTLLGTMGAASAAVAAPKPNVTVHLVEKSGLKFGFETKAAQVGPFKILVKVGQFNRMLGSEDFRVVKALDGSYKLEWAPNGHGSGRYLMVYEREQQGRDARTAFYVPDARLTAARFATVFRTGPAGPLGYSQLMVTHHEGYRGQKIERLVLNAEASGKLDLRPSQLIPGIGYPASQLWRLDTQIQLPPMHR